MIVFKGYSKILPTEECINSPKIYYLNIQTLHILKHKYFLLDIVFIPVEYKLKTISISNLSKMIQIIFRIA